MFHFIKQDGDSKSCIQCYQKYTHKLDTTVAASSQLTGGAGTWASNQRTTAEKDVMERLRETEQLQL